MRGVFISVMLMVRLCFGELEGPNVCTKTVEVVSLSPAIAKPYVETLCREGMPNCRETQKEEKPAIKIQHQIHSQAITECCSGYVENETKTGCIPLCSSQPCPNESGLRSCSSGNCLRLDRTTTCLFGEWDDRLNKCNCQPGHYGEKCNQQCPDGTYGYNCLSKCTCQNSATCNTINGECSCTEGWTGANCTDPCASGTWGANCKRLCDCHNDGTCHHVKGTCACTDEFIGTHCEQPCPIGTLAVNGKCRKECHCGTEDENCISDTPCVKSWIALQDHKGFWFFLVAFVTTVFLIAIFAALRLTRVPFGIVGKTAPLQDSGEANVPQENPLYNANTHEGESSDSCLLPHIYYEIQEDNRPNSVYQSLDPLPPDSNLQNHYINHSKL